MILVTGGAGYIGSHTTHLLREQGLKVVVLDNLSTGHKWAVPKDVDLVVGNSGDRELVAKTIRKYDVKAVIHFAGALSVEESVRNPIKYYDNNCLQSLALFETCEKYGVSNILFSSSCAVYGFPKQQPVTEDFLTQPVSPYGRSKLVAEWMLKDLASVSKSLKYMNLRYFNVAGAKVTGGLGQATVEAWQIVRMAALAACGKREKLFVFGTDYPTHDGTCIRDYIHVDDLAEAHILGLKYLMAGGDSVTLNCGYGKGYSVLEVIQSMKRVSGVDFQVEYAARRPGDPASVFADTSQIQKTLNWIPRFANLDLICKTSYEWERNYESLISRL